MKLTLAGVLRLTPNDPGVITFLIIAFFAAPAEAPKPTSPSEPYTYQVPEYDDMLFYNVESDMAKYRIAQPTPGKP